MPSVEVCHGCLAWDAFLNPLKCLLLFLSLVEICFHSSQSVEWCGYGCIVIKYRILPSQESFLLPPYLLVFGSHLVQVMACVLLWKRHVQRIWFLLSESRTFHCWRLSHGPLICSLEDCFQCLHFIYASNQDVILLVDTVRDVSEYLYVTSLNTSCKPTLKFWIIVHVRLFFFLYSLIPAHTIIVFWHFHSVQTLFKPVRLLKREFSALVRTSSSYHYF